MRVHHIFKFVCILGYMCGFTSFFFEWYSFSIHNFNNELLVAWQYHIFKEWTTTLSDVDVLNTQLKPNDLSVSMIVNVLFIIMMVCSSYGVIFKDGEGSFSSKALKKYNYFNFSALGLISFYVIIFPIIYLLPNNLYFPNVVYEDIKSGYIFHYSIGIGYILQLFSFVLVFPYVIFYAATLNNFEEQKKTPENQLNTMLKEIQEPIDLDTLIAKEEIKQRFDSPKSNLTKIEEED